MDSALAHCWFCCADPEEFPPFARGGKKTGLSPSLRNEYGTNAEVPQGRPFSGPKQPWAKAMCDCPQNAGWQGEGRLLNPFVGGHSPVDRLNRPAIGSGFAFSRLALSSAWWWSPMCAVEAIRAARSLRHGGGRGPDSCRSWNSFRVDPCFPWLEVPLKHFRFLIGPLLMSLMREITGLSRGRDRKGLTRKGRRASGSRLRDHDRPGFRRRIGEGSRPYELAGSLGIAFWRRGSSEKQLHDAIRWHDVYKPPSQPDSSHRA